MDNTIDDIDEWASAFQKIQNDFVALNEDSPPSKLLLLLPLIVLADCTVAIQSIFLSPTQLCFPFIQASTLLPLHMPNLV